MRITSEQFKQQVKSGSPDETATVLKAGPAMVLPALGERRLLWCISSGTPDRVGDIIDVNGWELANFIKGGSVLWAHDPSTLPVGKPVRTYVEDGKLWSVCEYPTADISEFGDTIYKMAVNGYLRGASIGMRPIEYAFDSARESPEHVFPITYKRQELLEWSHTPIPANPEALLAAKSMGVSIEPIRAWCARVLDESAELPGVTREELAKAYAITQTSTTIDMGATVAVETKEEPEMDEPLNPAAEPMTMVTERCHGKLDELLAMQPMFETCADEKALDLGRVDACVMMLNALSTIQAVEEVEDNQEEMTEADKALELTETEIRALVRAAIAASGIN